MNASKMAVPVLPVSDAAKGGETHTLIEFAFSRTRQRHDGALPAERVGIVTNAIAGSAAPDGGSFWNS